MFVKSKIFSFLTLLSCSAFSVSLIAKETPSSQPALIEQSISQVKDLSLVAEKVKQYRAAVGAQCGHHPACLKMFDEMTQDWQRYYLQKQGDFDIEMLLKATSLAALAHHGQTRDDAAKTPYIIHPMGVAKSLWEEGQVHEATTITAALLHDILEDTGATSAELKEVFGDKVAGIVQEVTNDPYLSGDENKQKQVSTASSLSLEARQVLLADRLSNIRDLRSNPPEWTEEKIKTSLQFAEKLLSPLKGTNAPLEKALEQEIAAQK